jgi:site-specific DNA-methyltransferase (adenine-specific)
MLKLYNDNCFNVLASLEDNSIDCILTDPPYYSTSLEFDSAPRIDFDLWFKECFRVLKNTGNLVCFADFKLAREISMRKQFRYELIWQKTLATGFLDANARPLKSHEYILIFIENMGRPSTPSGMLATYNPQKTQGEPYKAKKNVKSKLVAHYNYQNRKSTENVDGLRHPISVQTFNNNNYESPHPTAKPLEACEWLIRTYSNEGDVILDPFMGSGRTGLASLRNGRSYIGIELDEKYFNIASNLIHTKTGLFVKNSV